MPYLIKDTSYFSQIGLIEKQKTPSIVLMRAIPYKF
jgi:hypothetical protein